MSIFKRKKKALRTADNYSAEQMQRDHLASTAAFAATQPDFVPVTEDEQMREAEANMDQDDAVDAAADLTDRPITYSNLSSPDSVSYTTAETGSSYSDSGSSSSSDSGSSYSSDSGSSGGSDGGSF